MAQVTTGQLLGASHYLNQCWLIENQSLKNKLQGSCIKIQIFYLKKMLSKTSAKWPHYFFFFFFRPQCVKTKNCHFPTIYNLQNTGEFGFSICIWGVRYTVKVVIWGRSILPPSSRFISLVLQQFRNSPSWVIAPVPVWNRVKSNTVQNPSQTFDINEAKSIWMVQHKTTVTPLLKDWSYHSLYEAINILWEILCADKGV